MVETGNNSNQYYYCSKCGEVNFKIFPYKGDIGVNPATMKE